MQVANLQDTQEWSQILCEDVLFVLQGGEGVYISRLPATPNAPAEFALSPNISNIYASIVQECLQLAVMRESLAQFAAAPPAAPAAAALATAISQILVEFGTYVADLSSTTTCLLTLRTRLSTVTPTLSALLSLIDPACTTDLRDPAAEVLARYRELAPCLDTRASRTCAYAVRAALQPSVKAVTAALRGDAAAPAPPLLSPATAATVTSATAAARTLRARCGAAIAPPGPDAAGRAARVAGEALGRLEHGQAPLEPAEVAAFEHSVAIVSGYLEHRLLGVVMGAGLVRSLELIQLALLGGAGDVVGNIADTPAATLTPAPAVLSTVADAFISSSASLALPTPPARRPALAAAAALMNPLLAYAVASPEAASAAAAAAAKSTTERAVRGGVGDVFSFKVSSSTVFDLARALHPSITLPPAPAAPPLVLLLDVGISRAWPVSAIIGDAESTQIRAIFRVQALLAVAAARVAAARLAVRGPVWLTAALSSMTARLSERLCVMGAAGSAAWTNFEAQSRALGEGSTVRQVQGAYGAYLATINRGTGVMAPQTLQHTLMLGWSVLRIAEHILAGGVAAAADFGGEGELAGVWAEWQAEELFWTRLWVQEQ